MDFVAFLIFLISIGIFLSLGAHLFWQAAGRFMLAIGAIALVCSYVVTIAANMGFPSIVSLALGVASGFLLGTLVTLIARRLTMEEFLLLALAVSEAVRRLAFHLNTLTGGAYGLRMTTEWGAQTSVRFYSVAILALLLAWGLQRWFLTATGVQWRMVGGARRAAVLLGMNPLRTETIAGGIMGLAAGLAGAAHVVGLRYIHPDDFGVSLSLAALTVGLAARPRNLGFDVCILSAVLFGMREVLRIFDIGGTIRFAIHEVALGMVLVTVAFRLGDSPGGR